ncbi:MAG: hypothetical protein MJ181_11250 [Treponema sp.]|nr:hypothetical protein [Treponema sp.]
MDFYINGEKIDVSIESEKTVGDVLHSFAQECENNKAAVVGIKVNGKVIAVDHFEEAAKAALSGNEKFEFEVVTEPALRESFSRFSEELNVLADEIEQVPSLFISGKSSEANNSIKKLADAIDQFCHLAALASLFPETFNTAKIGDKNFTEFFEDFSPILTDFENALATNDTVLTGDLCEYEICPRLHDMANALACFNS